MVHSRGRGDRGDRGAAGVASPGRVRGTGAATRRSAEGDAGRSASATRGVAPGWRALLGLARQHPDRVDEEQWQEVVLSIAITYGWRVYHSYDARRSVPGYPDVTLVRRGRLIFAELKTTAGKVSPEQRAWLSDLSECLGVDTCVWRPSDVDTVLTTLM